MKKEWHLGENIFWVSLVTLAFETVLFRIFTFLFGYHFVSLLVALALLGYGMSGILSTRIPIWMKKNALWISGMFLVLFFLSVSFLPLDSYGIFLNPLSFLSLVLILLLTLVPFLIHGVVQIFSFECFPRFFSVFYGLNLLGSATGVGVGLLGLTFWEESRVLLLLALFSALDKTSLRWRIALTVVIALLFISPLTMYISPYAPSRTLLEVPDNERLQIYRSPVETMEVFSTPSSRVGWGLSLFFGDTPPSCFTLVFDHHNTEVFPREFPDSFLEALLLALPFRIERPQRVLVVEGKSGQEVYLAHHFQSEEIELVTSSFLFRSFLQDFIPSFPGKVLVTSPRKYIRKRQNSYDLITIRAPVGRASIFAGSFSFQEDFLFTCEGIAALLSALKERGILLLPIFLQNPPSLLPKLVRLLATVMGNENCLQSLMVLKNFDSALLIVKKGGWGEGDVLLWREEAKKWHFDFIYFLGGEEKDFEQVFRTGGRYFHALQEALQQNSTDNFFDLRPAKDHRPYFGNFFRFTQLREARYNLGKRWLPFGGAGFFLFLVVFALVTFLSSIGLLLPLRKVTLSANFSYRWLFLAGSICTGIGFMFLEISLFVRLHLLVGVPMYTFSLLLVALLLGSGWGSIKIKKGFSRNQIKSFAFFHLSLLGGYFLLLKFFGCSPFLLLPLFPLAYYTGMPFPILSELARRLKPGFFPILFAYNGFFSVISSLLVHLILVLFGMEFAFLLTFLSYLLFWFIALSFPE